MKQRRQASFQPSVPLFRTTQPNSLGQNTKKKEEIWTWREPANLTQAKTAEPEQLCCDLRSMETLSKMVVQGACFGKTVCRQGARRLEGFFVKIMLPILGWPRSCLGNLKTATPPTRASRCGVPLRRGPKLCNGAVFPCPGFKAATAEVPPFAGARAEKQQEFRGGMNGDAG